MTQEKRCEMSWLIESHCYHCITKANDLGPMRPDPLDELEVFGD